MFCAMFTLVWFVQDIFSSPPHTRVVSVLVSDPIQGVNDQFEIVTMTTYLPTNTGALFLCPRVFTWPSVAHVALTVKKFMQQITLVKLTWPAPFATTCSCIVANFSQTLQLEFVVQFSMTSQRKACLMWSYIITSSGMKTEL